VGTKELDLDFALGVSYWNEGFFVRVLLAGIKRLLLGLDVADISDDIDDFFPNPKLVDRDMEVSVFAKWGAGDRLNAILADEKDEKTQGVGPSPNDPTEVGTRLSRDPSLPNLGAWEEVGVGRTGGDGIAEESLDAIAGPPYQDLKICLFSFLIRGSGAVITNGFPPPCAVSEMYNPVSLSFPQMFFASGVLNDPSKYGIDMLLA
jgi:hypothetical protein